MAVADRTIDPRIIRSAKDEFLKTGFEKASLSVICKNAGVTTGALYKRYSGKEALFRAVVADTVDALDSVVEQKCNIKLTELPDDALISSWDMDEQYMLWWFRYLYDHHDGFVLLLRSAEGTSYSNFQHDWVEKMTVSTYMYYQEARKRGLSAKAISKEELHILLSSFWTTIYEPFIHGFTWEQIQNHCKLVCSMFNWHSVLGLNN